MNVETQALISIGGVVATFGVCYGVVKTKLNGTIEALSGIQKDIKEVVKEMRVHHENPSIHVTIADPPVTRNLCLIQHAGIEKGFADGKERMDGMTTIMQRVERNQIKIAANLGIEITEGE